MPEKDAKYSCRECGAQVVCMIGGGCGMANKLLCCGNEMKKIPAHSSPTEKQA
jgi:hypothetical protein